MPHREPLRRMLFRYLELWPGDGERVRPVLDLLAGSPRCFERDHLPGHVTASAWILSADRSKSLMTHHKKLARWLQLGGHADGDPAVEQVAVREAREESGLGGFDLVQRDGELVPLDVDVHWIPQRMAEPGHWHHDVRFLLLARGGESIAISAESNDLRWFTDAEVCATVHEESVLRLLARARERLA